MHWIFAAVVLVLCVYHRTFRHICLSLAAVAVLLVGGVVVWTSFPSKQVVPVSAPQPSDTASEALYRDVYGTAPPPAGRDLSQELFGTPPSSKVSSNASTPEEAAAALHRLRARVRAQTH